MCVFVWRVVGFEAYASHQNKAQATSYFDIRLKSCVVCLELVLLCWGSGAKIVGCTIPRIPTHSARPKSLVRGA